METAAAEEAIQILLQMIVRECNGADPQLVLEAAIYSPQYQPNPSPIIILTTPPIFTPLTPIITQFKKFMPTNYTYAYSFYPSFQISSTRI